MAKIKDLNKSGWMDREPDKFEQIRKTIEKAKNMPPSREYVQEQIDHIFQGSVYFDRIIAALQALLELVELKRSDKPEIIQVVCPECKGAGRVIDHYNSFRHDAELVATYKTCESCRGTGKVNGGVQK